MALGRKNHVKIDPTSYNFMLLGEPKIGKTTVMMEALEKLVGENGYLFAELGRERGADAIEGINYINCPEWNADYDEDENSIGWEDLVDDICDNKASEYPDLKVIVMDTYDQYITIAEKYALYLWNKQNPDKKAPTLNGAWGGFGAGSKKAIELMFEQIDRLDDVGVKVWWVGHVKNKALTDVVTGESYEVLTSDQQQNYFNALKKNLHFLGLALIDREIVKEKTGKKNIVTKKDEVKSIVKEETRKIKFRDDSYAVDSGSRFKNIVSEIDLDADQLIMAMTDAIKAEHSKSSQTLEESQEIEKALAEKKMKEVAEAEKLAKLQAEEAEEVAKLMKVLSAYIKDNKSDMKKITPLLSKAKDLGYSNPLEVNKLADVKELVALIA